MTFPTISAGTRANEAIGGYANFVAYCNALAAGVDSVTTTAAGAALKANNLSDLTSASTARTNLGLGTAAVADTGTGAGTVAAGDDSRIVGAAQKAANLTDLTDAALARAALGLGSASQSATTDFDAAGSAATAQSAAQSYAAALVDDLSGVTDAVAARAALGLGTMATESANAYAALTAANTFTAAQTISANADTVGPMLLLRDTSANAASRVWRISNAMGSSPYGALGFQVGATAGGTPANDPKLIILSDGKVGVGITTPTSLLHVAGPTFIDGSTDVTQLRVQGVAGQSQPPITVENSSASVLASISANGTGTFAGVSCGSFVNGATNPYLHLNSNRNGVGVINRDVITQIPFHVQGMAGQTGNLTNWLDGSAVTLASVTAAGLHRWDAAANQQTTVGAAGGASALPATPTKYLKVVDSTGATLVIPAYAAA